MSLREHSPALHLPCLAILLAAQAASATTPEPIVGLYPQYSTPPWPSNLVIVAHARRSFQLDPTHFELTDPMGNVIPSTITPDVDERGGIRVVPSAPLPDGNYILATGAESFGLNISNVIDTTPPSAIVQPTVTVADRSKDFLGDVFIEFPAPKDDLTPRSGLGYDIWVSQSPAEPDLASKPTLMGAQGEVFTNGMTQVSLAPGALCVAILPSGGSGRFIVRMRARDAAGNLGPVSDLIVVRVDEVPECSTPADDIAEGCSTVPVLAPTAWVAVALWLRRRRR